MKRSKMKWRPALATCMLFVLASAIPSPAQERPETTMLGTRWSIASKALGEEREIVVTLPDGYAESQANYPLLILLDGDGLPAVATATACLSRWGHVPSLIVATVLTPTPRHHYRDFTPVTEDSLPASGGAGKFLEFLNLELLPFLEEKYRCLPYRVLAGHGLSGLFALYALLERPKTYGAALATSPAIAFKDRWILPLAERRLGQWPGGRRFVFLAAGREKVTVPAMQEFEAVMKKSGAAGLEWACRVLDDEDQGSVALSGFYLGLKALFADWRFPAELAVQGLPAIERHFQSLSRKYGMALELNEEVLVKRSVQLFQEQAFDDSLAILSLGAQAYPESIQVPYWLGFVNEKLKKLEQARNSYELAFRRAEATKHPMAGFYKQQFERLAKKIEAK